jgi:hypothetical protein
VVDPATGAITEHELDYRGQNSKKPLYSGSMAFDGSGQLWMAAADIENGREKDVLMAYTPEYNVLVAYPVPTDCAVGQGSAPELVYPASDGAVWLVCLNARGNAYVERMTQKAESTPAHVVTDGPAGSMLLSVQQAVANGMGLDGPLVAGSGGVMWGIPGNFGGTEGVAEFDPSGEEHVTLPLDPGPAEKDKPIDAVDVEMVGNGTATPLILASCMAVLGTNPYAQDITCLNTFTATAKKPLALMPDFAGYNERMVPGAAMDSGGTVWEVLDGKVEAAPPNGQYLAGTSPSGAVSVYPFSVPGATNGPVNPSIDPPAVTANGGVWFMTTLGAQSGRLVEVIPKK